MALQMALYSIALGSTMCQALHKSDASYMQKLAVNTTSGTPTCTLRSDLSTLDTWTPVTVGGFTFVKTPGYAGQVAGYYHYDYYRIGSGDGQYVTEEECALLGYYLLQQDGQEAVRAVVHNGGGRCDIQSDDGHPPSVIMPAQAGPFRWTSAADHQTTTGPVTAGKSIMGHDSWTVFIYDGCTNIGTSQGGSSASATGDPHLQNVHGERFDLMKAGKHVLINIPRGERAEHALLRVQAEATQLGGQCADMYFQELNVTGSWAEAKQAGGYRYSVSHSVAGSPEWVAFGKVELKVVHALTGSGLGYLNVYVKHLGRAGFAVGGLLGEDDHEDVVTPGEECVKRLALNKVKGRGKVHSVVSVAEASLA